MDSKTVRLARNLAHPTILEQIALDENTNLVEVATPEQFIGKSMNEIDIKRLIKRRLIMAIADARMYCDGTEIYTASDLRVGLFQRSEAQEGGAA